MVQLGQGDLCLLLRIWYLAFEIQRIFIAIFLWSLFLISGGEIAVLLLIYKNNPQGWSLSIITGFPHLCLHDGINYDEVVA